MICLKPCNVTKQPWFLDCHELLLSMYCGIMILSWTSTLHKKKAFSIVKYYILKQNYRNWLKMKIAPDVYYINKLVSHKKESVKRPYKPAFYVFICLWITENQSLWAFQSDRSLPPVLQLKLENNVVFIDLILSFQCHLVLSIISVFFTKT